MPDKNYLFQGRMDVTTAAVMGHSFGGATTVQTLSEDTRFRYKNTICGYLFYCSLKYFLLW